MDARIASGLLRSLHLPDLDLPEAAMPETVRNACDDLASVVTQMYLSGNLSWVQADRVANSFYGIMIRDCGGQVPDFAWAVYLAFDTAECTLPGGDVVTKPLLLAAVERMPNTALGRHTLVTSERAE